VNPHQQGKPAPMNPQKFYASIAVFASDETMKELDIIGIQLESIDDAKVCTKTDGNQWLLALCNDSSLLYGKQHSRVSQSSWKDSFDNVTSYSCDP